MHVLFKSRHPHAASLRDLTERRVRFVLRRLVERIPRTEVQLSDVNGPRGGIDKRCQVRIRADAAGTVVVASVASDWRTALDDALARAGRLLMRLWRRGNDSRRHRRASTFVRRSRADTLVPTVGAAKPDPRSFD